MCMLWPPKLLTMPVTKDLKSKENSCVCLKVSVRTQEGAEPKVWFILGLQLFFSSGVDGQIQIRRHIKHTRFNSTGISSLCPWQEFRAFLVCDRKALNEAPNSVFCTESQVTSHDCMCLWDILLPHSQVSIGSFAVRGEKKTYFRNK